jgi:hypothetical protein
VNVTQRVQSIMQNGWLNFQVTPQALGVSDPAFGVVKTLSIGVRQWNGQTRNYQFQDFSQVNLQVGGGNNPNGVVRATYGYGGTRLDVTPQVQSMVQPNGALNFRVTNETLGVRDPAPGRLKDLRIHTAQVNGRTHDYTFQEKSQVAINVGNSNRPPGPVPPIPGSTWKGNPIPTCINAVRSRIQQDYGNRTLVNLPASAARVGSVSVGQLMIPVSGTGQITRFGQPVINTRYDCSIDKRFGNVSSVNYTRPDITPSRADQQEGGKTLSYPNRPFHGFTTCKLLVTEKTPLTLLARMPATFLSPSLSTTPSRVTRPLLTMMRIGFCTPSSYFCRGAYW